MRSLLSLSWSGFPCLDLCTRLYDLALSQWFSFRLGERAVDLWCDASTELSRLLSFLVRFSWCFTFDECLYLATHYPTLNPARRTSAHGGDGFLNLQFLLCCGPPTALLRKRHRGELADLAKHFAEEARKVVVYEHVRHSWWLNLEPADSLRSQSCFRVWVEESFVSFLPLTPSASQAEVPSAAQTGNVGDSNASSASFHEKNGKVIRPQAAVIPDR